MKNLEPASGKGEAQFVYGIAVQLAESSAEYLQHKGRRIKENSFILPFGLMETEKNYILSLRAISLLLSKVEPYKEKLTISTINNQTTGALDILVEKKSNSTKWPLIESYFEKIKNTLISERQEAAKNLIQTVMSIVPSNASAKKKAHLAEVEKTRETTPVITPFAEPQPPTTKEQTLLKKHTAGEMFSVAETAFLTHSLAQTLFSFFDDEISQTTEKGKSGEYITLSLPAPLETDGLLKFFCIQELLDIAIKTVAIRPEHGFPDTAFCAKVLQNEGNYSLSLVAEPPYTLKDFNPLREKVLHHLTQHFLPSPATVTPKAGRLPTLFNRESPTWQTHVSAKKSVMRPLARSVRRFEQKCDALISNPDEKKGSLEALLEIQKTLVSSLGNRSSLARLIHDYIEEDLKAIPLGWEEKELKRQQAALCENGEGKGCY